MAKKIICKYWNQKESSIIFEDNQGAIELSRNQKHHNRIKHIEICYHFIRERMNSKKMYVEYFLTENMLANIMTTQALPK